MNSITFNGDAYSIPSEWDEISTNQLELIAKILQASTYPIDMLVKLSLSFMGMRLSTKKYVTVDGISHYYIKHGWRNTYLVNSLQVHAISKCIEYVIPEGKIDSKLTRNPYPKLPFLFKTLHGPADAFINLTFGEFIQAEIERDMYHKTGNPEHFNRMIAILWRPSCRKHPDSDLRKPLRMDRVNRNARLINRLPKHKKQVIQWYLDGCLYALYSKFSMLFTSEGGGTASVFDSFMDMVNQLADKKLIDVEGIRAAYLYDAFYTLKNITENSRSNGN